MREQIDNFYLESIALNSPKTEDLTPDFKELLPEQKSPEPLSSETKSSEVSSPEFEYFQHIVFSDDIEFPTSPKKNKRHLSEISSSSGLSPQPRKKMQVHPLIEKNKLLKNLCDEYVTHGPERVSTIIAKLTDLKRIKLSSLILQSWIMEYAACINSDKVIFEGLKSESARIRILYSTKETVPIDEKAIELYYSYLSSIIEKHAFLKQQNESVFQQLNQMYTQATVDFKKEKEREKLSLQVEQERVVDLSPVFINSPGL